MSAAAQSSWKPVLRPALAALAWLTLLGGLPLLRESGFTPRMVHAQDRAANPQIEPTTLRNAYVGDAACRPCHGQQAKTYLQTAHHLTSQLPTTTSILGSFQDGQNILRITNPDPSSDEPRLFFKMEKTSTGARQTAVAEKGSQRLTHSESIDFVVGSGTRGQSYLYWKGDHLLELPVSYWTEGHQWINSPGYTDGTANFDRHVNARCLECHVSYIETLSADPQSNAYNQQSLTPGISCENCHGPGSDHAAYQRAQHPSVAKTDSRKPTMSLRDAIINPAKLSHDRQIDQCALCHNGTQSVELLPAFTYRPGDPLDRFLAANPADVSDHPDVHGNQVGLLKRSRCFLASPSMSCATCHDPHQPERPAAEYSDRCLTCHQWQTCGASHKLGINIKRNCIDCHMPLQLTRAIVSETAGRALRTSIRTHWIAVYRNEKTPSQPGKEKPE